jgi:uncharacterized protein (DUF2384 family)
MPVISELRHIIGRLVEFYTPEEMRVWLHSRHRLLDGERPIDLIRRGCTDEVIAVVDGLDAGTYT